MCPLKREQATRVSYNTLTHSRLYCRDIVRKSRSWINHFPVSDFIHFYLYDTLSVSCSSRLIGCCYQSNNTADATCGRRSANWVLNNKCQQIVPRCPCQSQNRTCPTALRCVGSLRRFWSRTTWHPAMLNVKCNSDACVQNDESLRGHCTNERRVRKRDKKVRRDVI